MRNQNTCTKPFDVVMTCVVFLNTQQGLFETEKEQLLNMISLQLIS